MVPVPFFPEELLIFVMPLLIDGYNLMYAAGILGGNSGPGTLERRRLALLNFLAESLEPEELPQTTVVFDAREPPWGLKQSVRHRDILVRFATKYESANALIEELIRAASAPRRLVVVSSDHENPTGRPAPPGQRGR